MCVCRLEMRGSCKYSEAKNFGHVPKTGLDSELHQAELRTPGKAPGWRSVCKRSLSWAQQSLEQGVHLLY